MNHNGSFGQWLKQRRKALDLTQADLADQVGCSTMTIRKIEADERRPSRQISERMADVLAISQEERPAFVAFARQIKSSLLANLNAPTPTSNLPPPNSPFIGRESELTQIAERLADPTCRLLTLVGPGGIGKTRLALQAAGDCVAVFTDGVYFVSLTPVGAATFIASAIASALQISFYGQEDPNVQLVNYLRSKHMLLVLDNYEHLLGDVDLLVNILANAPRLKLVVTSRERLNLVEEWILPVGGLPYPIRATDTDLSSYSALQLFVQAARRLQPDFMLAENLDGVISICQTVEGMPLGLELAATWLRVMPCQQIAAQIRRNLDFLATTLRNVPERHRSLRAVFEHSWSLLSATERDVLMKLSVFRGGFDSEAAEPVAGASLSLLTYLLDKSLIRLNASNRYEMHELLRQFAGEKLLEANTTNATQQRHLQFFLALAEQLEPKLFGPLQVVSLDRLEVEHANLRAALHESARVGGDAESGLRLAGALGWFWNRRTYWIEGLEWLRTFLTIGHDAPLSARAKALHHSIELGDEYGDHDYAAALRETGLKLVDAVADLQIKAWLLTSIGWTASLPEHLEEGLRLFRKIGDQWGISESVGRLAGIAYNRHDFVRARQLHEEAIYVARQAGDKGVLCFMLVGLGCQNWYEGKIDHLTEHLYLESLELFRELDYKMGLVWVLLYLGKISHAWGEDERAKIFLEQGCLLSQQIGNNGYMMRYLIVLAEGLFAPTMPEQAARLLGSVSEMVPSLFAGSGLFETENRAIYERGLATASAQLDEATFAAAFAEGQRMSLDQAIAYALQSGD